MNLNRFPLLLLTALPLLAGVNPVPEPSTYALMAVGIAGIGIAAWRKNRKK